MKNDLILILTLEENIEFQILIQSLTLYINEKVKQYIRRKIYKFDVLRF